VAAEQNNLPVIYSYCNSFFMRDVRGEFGLINVHLFDIMPAISSGQVRENFGIICAVLRMVTLHKCCIKS